MFGEVQVWCVTYNSMWAHTGIIAELSYDGEKKWFRSDFGQTVTGAWCFNTVVPFPPADAKPLLYKGHLCTFIIDLVTDPESSHTDEFPKKVHKMHPTHSFAFMIIEERLKQKYLNVNTGYWPPNNNARGYLIEIAQKLEFLGISCETRSVQDALAISLAAKKTTQKVPTKYLRNPERAARGVMM